MSPPVLLAADVLTSETLVPVGAALSVLLVAVGGARAYEALRSTQNTLREDLDGVADDLKTSKERSDKRHEDLVHRVSTTESRESVHDQRMAGVEDHLRQQDKKLDKIDDKLDRVLMRDDRRRKDDAA